jgi:hypothetical protein
MERTTKQNLVERLHGIVRDREKVMRGLNIEDTPIINGHMITTTSLDLT